MKAITWLVAALLLVSGFASGEQGLELELSAESAILIEPVSGRILYQKDCRQRRPMASTTKIMTAIVAYELAELEEEVEIAPEAVGIEGCSLYLEEGERLLLRELLYGLILRSGNDAAAAIAIHVAGSIPHFANLMNRKAWELGLHNTHFVNPHGLDHPEHYSTAHDLALLGAAYMQYPLLREIAVTESMVSQELITGRVRLMYNRNKLLERDQRALGIKTGWTENSGACLVAAARQDNMELIAVVMKAPGLYSDVIRLFDYGFSQVTMEELVPRGKIVATLPVRGGNLRRVPVVLDGPVMFPVFAGEAVSFAIDLQLPERLSAPLAEGEQVGTAQVRVDNRWTMAVDVVVGQAVASQPGPWARLLNWVKGWRR